MPKDNKIINFPPEKRYQTEMNHAAETIRTAVIFAGMSVAAILVALSFYLESISQ